MDLRSSTSWTSLFSSEYYVPNLVETKLVECKFGSILFGRLLNGRLRLGIPCWMGSIYGSHHGSQECLYSPEVWLEVNVEKSSNLVIFQNKKSLSVNDARIVYENVYIADLFSNQFSSFVDCLPVTDVTLERETNLMSILLLMEWTVSLSPTLTMGWYEERKLFAQITSVFKQHVYY